MSAIARLRRRVSEAARRLPAEVHVLLRLMAAGFMVCTATRLAFLFIFADRLAEIPWLARFGALAAGAVLDLSFLAWLLLPVWVLVFLPRAHWAHRRWVRVSVMTWTGVCAFLLLLGAVSDLAHYQEFDVRLNGASLDYLRQPGHLLSVLHHEFFLLPAVAALGLATWICVHRQRKLLLTLAPSAASGGRRGIVAIAALLGLLVIGGAAPTLASARYDSLTQDYLPRGYVVDQMVENGSSNIVAAWLTELAGEAVRKERLLDMPAAFDEVCELVDEPGATFVEEGPNLLWRSIDTGRAERRSNVVVILMESFTAQGIASLGGRHDDAPRFDELAADGVLFDRHFAVGTRTNRGLAGVLSSLPALPGLSPICELEAGGKLYSLMDVLNARGYRSVGLYGGDREYDNLEAYARTSGVERLISRRNFESPHFETEWGVSDEDLFDRALQEFDALGAEEDPFFGFVLTLSNHRPYRVPAGRVAELRGDPEETRARNTFRYADWALGRFFDEARERPWFDDTLFVLVADHGREMRGGVGPDVAGFRVPLLLYAPSWLPAERVTTTCSQLDVAPTVLGLLGGSYEACFFGRDALGPAAPDRAIMSIGDVLLWMHEDVVGMLPSDGPVEGFTVDEEFALTPLGNRSPRSFRSARRRLLATAVAAEFLCSRGAYRAFPLPPSGDAR